MEKRITLKDIAKETGVHFSTVSLALRDDPRLSEETRKKVQKAAKEMGYVPDPAMKALCAYRSTTLPHPVRSGLAYLTDMPSSNPFGAMVYRYAKARAEKMGYNLIEFNLSDPGTRLKHFRSVWWNTGLKGVLVGPFEEPGVLLDGEWDRWVVVAYGYSVASPDFNRAVMHHFHNMLTHLSELRKRGYRRIGLHLPKQISSRTYGLQFAAYLMDQRMNNPDGNQIDVLRTDDMTDFNCFEQWVEKEKLDAVIGHPEEYRYLISQGVRIPEDLGFSFLSWKRFDPDMQETWAGFDYKAELLADASISFLVSLLHEQAYGILETPRLYMIPGTFHEGTTLCAAD